MCQASLSLKAPANSSVHKIIPANSDTKLVYKLVFSREPWTGDLSRGYQGFLIIDLYIVPAEAAVGNSGDLVFNLKKRGGNKKCVKFLQANLVKTMSQLPEI